MPYSTKSTSSRHDLSGIKFALVYPPYGPVKNEPGIKTVKENYGIFPSLSLLYVAGILENVGVEVLFIDAHAEDLTLEETVRRLNEFGPDFIGYTLTTYLFFQSLDWIKAIKELEAINQQCKLVQCHATDANSCRSSTSMALQLLLRLLCLLLCSKRLADLRAIPLCLPPRFIQQDTFSALSCS